MSQVLYCLIMLMWANQLSYDIETIYKLRRFAKFLVLFIIPA